MCFMCKLRVAGKELRAATMCVMCKVRVAGMELREVPMCVMCKFRYTGQSLRAATMCVMSKYYDAFILMLCYLIRVIEDVKKNLARIHK